MFPPEKTPPPPKKKRVKDWLEHFNVTIFSSKTADLLRRLCKCGSRQHGHFIAFLLLWRYKNKVVPSIRADWVSKGKRKSHVSQGGPHDQSQAYPGFCSVKQLRVVHRRVTPNSLSLVLIYKYTPGWRETMWGKVSCLSKQHDRRDWVSSHPPSDLKSNALTTTPPHPLSTECRK